MTDKSKVNRGYDMFYINQLITGIHNIVGVLSIPSISWGDTNNSWDWYHAVLKTYSRFPIDTFAIHNDTFYNCMEPK